jgi:aminomethyltransferase
MVPFAGWEMPVQYPTGILAEHHAVRTAAGIFDVSHMGEFEITGPDRNAFVNRVTCNDVGALESGQVQYSGILTPEGTFVDDCTVYRFEDKLMIVVNASNATKAWEHIVAQKGGANVRLKDISSEVGLLSIQGPDAESLVQPLTRTNLSDIPYYHFTTGRVADAECFISRTGYTGEDGFELYVPAGQAERLWSALLEAGRGDGIKPIGLGARDTLRLEMKYALYGNDIDQTTNPLEAGLGWVVKPAKGEFIGRAAVEALRARGVGRKLVGFEMVERAVPRHGYRLLAGGAPVGVVTSGSFGPSVERSIGMGYVASPQTAVGTALTVEIRGALHPARVVKTPFHPSHTKKA